MNRQNERDTDLTENITVATLVVSGKNGSSYSRHYLHLTNADLKAKSKYRTFENRQLLLTLS